MALFTRSLNVVIGGGLYTPGLVGCNSAGAGRL